MLYTAKYRIFCHEKKEFKVKCIIGKNYTDFVQLRIKIPGLLNSYIQIQFFCRLRSMADTQGSCCLSALSASLASASSTVSVSSSHFSFPFNNC